MPTVHLSEPLDDRTTIDCDAVELRGTVVWLEADDDRLVVPVDNLAGVRGEAVDRDVEHLPTQGGQYAEVVTTISEGSRVI